MGRGWSECKNTLAIALVLRLRYAYITLLVGVLWAERRWVTTFEPLCLLLTDPYLRLFLAITYLEQ